MFSGLGVVSVCIEQELTQLVAGPSETVVSFPFGPPVSLEDLVCILPLCLLFFGILSLPGDNYLPLITIILLFLPVFPVSNKTMLVEKLHPGVKQLCS